ncbi:MAG: hypothetical protein LBR07_00955 [Puniceicoccales bacterium]|jgi:hypothetical protein|nr:hypothetical protein [Puniceicoccales bacterium]
MPSNRAFLFAVAALLAGAGCSGGGGENGGTGGTGGAGAAPVAQQKPLDLNADNTAVAREQFGGRAESFASLREQFTGSVADCYKPHVWWHWLGKNFSKSGITKDLEAMKEAGVGGAVLFYVAPFLGEPSTPWPQNGFRNETYWDAVGHALREARRLGLKIGFNNSPGWSATGGPWVPEEFSMQTLLTTKATATVPASTGSATGSTAGSTLSLSLPAPKLPANHKGRAATRFHDIGIYAVPRRADATVRDVLDLAPFFDSATGALTWKNAPAGDWLVVRLGHASNCVRPHPVGPEVQEAFEVDKLSRPANVHHWRAFLAPLRERFPEFVGTTITNVWVDSYEVGDQQWTPGFEQKFIRQKGYDPRPWLALREQVDRKRDDARLFDADFRAVKNRLFQDEGWATAREELNKSGLAFLFEPYASVPPTPFSITEGAANADVPVSEFWTHERRMEFEREILDAAKSAGKRIVAAESFTGMEANPGFAADPASLKPAADGVLVSGVNLFFLHTWTHQPFDDRWQPGTSLGNHGTRFGRHQTWHRPGRAFFAYLARCQMLLQQGTFAGNGADHVTRRVAEGTIHFLNNGAGKAATKTWEFDAAATGTDAPPPELWDPYTATVHQLAPENWSRADGKLRLTLTLEQHRAVFVLQPAKATKYAKLPAAKNFATGTKSTDLTAGPWLVRFQPKLGTAFERTFEKLEDLSASTDPEVRYFSGTATYVKNFAWQPPAIEKRTFPALLDLGVLNDIAEVRVNGAPIAHPFGVLWSPPYRADISALLRAGENTLEIAVTNNWCNALIGDEQFPRDFDASGRTRADAMKSLPEWFIKAHSTGTTAAGTTGTAPLPRPEPRRKTFTPWFWYNKNSRLHSAGLVGPVTLTSTKE